MFQIKKLPNLDKIDKEKVDFEEWLIARARMEEDWKKKKLEEEKESEMQALLAEM